MPRFEKPRPHIDHLLDRILETWSTWMRQPDGPPIHKNNVYGNSRQALAAWLMKFLVSLVDNNTPRPNEKTREVYLPLVCPHLFWLSIVIMVNTPLAWRLAGVLPLKAAIELWRKHRFVNQAKAKQLLESNNQWLWTNNKSLVAASEDDKWWEIGPY